mmetsp:Transcript_65323/g.155986  ORF Transcript_65323/g.155986 Transcript_65323/m.155986 type:complete len:207 (+) Transcript_65323:730-1350(+)
MRRQVLQATGRHPNHTVSPGILRHSHLVKACAHPRERRKGWHIDDGAHHLTPHLLRQLARQRVLEIKFRHASWQSKVPRSDGRICKGQSRGRWRCMALKTNVRRGGWQLLRTVVGRECTLLCEVAWIWAERQLRRHSAPHEPVQVAHEDLLRRMAQAPDKGRVSRQDSTHVLHHKAGHVVHLLAREMQKSPRQAGLLVFSDRHKPS